MVKNGITDEAYVLVLVLNHLDDFFGCFDIDGANNVETHGLVVLRVFERIVLVEWMLNETLELAAEFLRKKPCSGCAFNEIAKATAARDIYKIEFVRHMYRIYVVDRRGI
jgi:hypothetical protein